MTYSAVLCCAAVQDLIRAGRGRLPARGTESGQVLINLVEHADVAEWALWINSFSDSVYRAVWGDKDTYALAFAVAGKAHVFNQIQVGAAVLSGGPPLAGLCCWLRVPQLDASVPSGILLADA